MQAESRARKDKYLSAHEVSPELRNSILSGNPALGMNKEQVMATMGEPSRINRETNQFGTTEQWVYGEKTYLYFESGILKSWQD